LSSLDNSATFSGIALTEETTVITSLSITVDHTGDNPVTMATLHGEDVAYLFGFLGGFDYVIDGARSKSVENTRTSLALSIVAELYWALRITTRDLLNVDNPVLAMINATTVTLFCQVFVSQLAAGQGQRLDITVHTD
jgi:hypothetical protein